MRGISTNAQSILFRRSRSTRSIRRTQSGTASIVGPRRIGKSSLLFYVANRFAQHLSASQNYRFTYIHSQDASTLTPEGLLKQLLIGLGAPPRNTVRLTLAKFQDAINALKNEGAWPVILIDEFEQVFDHAGLIAPDIFDSWRYLMNANAAAFISASKTLLTELADQQKLTSPFFNVFTFIPLGEFPNNEAKELLERGANCDQPFGLNRTRAENNFCPRSSAFIRVQFKK